MIVSLMCAVALHALAADVAVVCPAEFRSELDPWMRHRAQQGHKLVWINPVGTADQLRARLAEVAKREPLTHVVLVGDAVNPAIGSRVTAPTVSTYHVRAQVNVRWGSEPEIASDNPLTDFDGDGLPEVAIGRLPADSAAELRLLVRKILAYEANVDYGPWRRRVNFVAGLGGFGALADAALEAATKKLITDGVPAAYSTSMTYGSWRSPYCPDPRAFRHATLDRLNEGCLFWVYIGHGHRREVDWVRVPGGEFPILADQDVPRLQCRSGSPIACFLACYAGAYDHPEDCLAEDMLRAPGGPVAVYAGSRVTMPYAMAVMGLGMLETCFGADPPPTIGEAVQRTKRRMMDTENLDTNRKALDGLAALVSPAPADLAAERREHLHLFNLLGDPLLRLPQSHRVKLTAAANSRPGDAVSISGTSEIAGEATVELVVRRDRLTFSPPARPEFEPTESFLQRLNDVYRHANDPCLKSIKLTVPASGEFACSLECPADAKGPCHVRAFVTGENSCALGHCDLELAP